jgi:hypothetical protein
MLDRSPVGGQGPGRLSSIRILSTAQADSMRLKSRFEDVEAIGRALPGVEVSTTYGQPALKVHGKMFVCLPSHRSAEPDSLVARLDFADRDALVEEEPDTYYLKDHYVGSPCVLVRLSRVHPDALRDLVVAAHRFVSAAGDKRSGPRSAPGPRSSRGVSRRSRR